jgi:hypothetical protein
MNRRSRQVPYVPGYGVRSVTKFGYSPVEVPELPGRHPKPITLRQDARWGSRGILAVAMVLALSAIADGGILLLLAWLQ